MTIAATVLTSGAGTGPFTGSPTRTITPSPDPVANRLQLLVIVYSRPSSTQPVAPTSIVGNGITWELVTSYNFDASGSLRHSAYVYRACPSSPTSGSTVITHGFTSTGATAWAWVEFSDTNPSANGATAVVQAVAATGGTSDSPSATLSAFADASNATLGIAPFGTTVTGGTAGSGFTKLCEHTASNGGSNPVGLFVEFRNDPDTSVDVALGSGAGAQGSGMLAIELRRLLTQSGAVTFTPNVAMTVDAGGLEVANPLAVNMAPEAGVAVTFTRSKPRPRVRRRVLVYVRDLHGNTRGVIS